MPYKYPRTPHLPWSQGISKDDKVISNLKGFDNKRVVITEKMDGENITLYKDYIHARSLSPLSNHSSRSYIKQLYASLSFNIPSNYRICGENLYAKHSIYYENLKSYFLVFNIWKGNICLDWNQTLIICRDLNLHTVPIIYEGIWDESYIKDKIRINENIQEGYVCRVIDEIERNEFNQKVGKYVRKNHVNLSNHWLNQTITPNQIIKEPNN